LGSLLRSIAGFKGPTSKGRGEKSREGRRGGGRGQGKGRERKGERRENGKEREGRGRRGLCLEIFVTNISPWPNVG